MPKLPGGPHSWRATEIDGMIAEGRAEEAMHKLAALLEGGDADPAIQALAAKWVLALGLRPGDAKRLRDGKPEQPDEWIDVAQMVRDRQDAGMSRAAAEVAASEHFNYCIRHVQTCCATYNAARSAE